MLTWPARAAVLAPLPLRSKVAHSSLHPVDPVEAWAAVHSSPSGQSKVTDEALHSLVTFPAGSAHEAVVAEYPGDARRSGRTPWPGQPGNDEPLISCKALMVK